MDASPSASNRMKAHVMVAFTEGRGREVFVLDRSLVLEIQQTLYSGMVQAIKFLRKNYKGMSLRDAKLICETIRTNNPC